MWAYVHIHQTWENIWCALRRGTVLECEAAWRRVLRPATRNMYCLQYPETPKAFFMPQHVGHCWATACSNSGTSYHCCVTECSNKDTWSWRRLTPIWKGGRRTDRHWLAHRLFFAPARSWGTTKVRSKLYKNILQQGWHLSPELSVCFEQLLWQKRKIKISAQLV
jgi:hypothetical protein